MLVVLGLLISIPIVIWGSQLILKFVERYPVIVYVGAAVLAWTAVKMVTSEPLLQPWVAEYPVLVYLSYAVVIGGVLLTGFLRNHREVRKLIAAHLVHVQAITRSGARRSGNFKRNNAMTKILLPVDGSANSLKAARHVVEPLYGKSGS